MLKGMDLSSSLRLQAHANRLANHRFHAALAALTHADFHAARTSFFPSLAATLNHILAVDAYYIGALHGDTEIAQGYDCFVAADELQALAERQRVSDERLIAFCGRLDAPGCDAVVLMDRSHGNIQRDLVCHVLSHLFMHQTHHRGQAHAMLAGTAVAPPQLDEFLMPSDAPWRVADMAVLGWDEVAVYSGAA